MEELVGDAAAEDPREGLLAGGPIDDRRAEKLTEAAVGAGDLGDAGEFGADLLARAMPPASLASWKRLSA